MQAKLRGGENRNRPRAGAGLSDYGMTFADRITIGLLGTF